MRVDAITPAATSPPAPRTLDSGARRRLLPEDRLWTVHDVSYFLGVPVATLYQWRSLGKGPTGRKIGRYVRYRPGDVFDWVNASPEDERH